MIYLNLIILFLEDIYNSQSNFTMKEYIVIKGGSIEVLMNDVNLMLKDGWSLQGGIALTQDIKENRSPRIKYTFYQAMAR